jgi:hypothetical protein
VHVDLPMRRTRADIAFATIIEKYPLGEFCCRESDVGVPEIVVAFWNAPTVSIDKNTIS